MVPETFLDVPSPIIITKWVFTRAYRAIMLPNFLVICTDNREGYTSCAKGSLNIAPFSRALSHQLLLITQWPVPPFPAHLPSTSHPAPLHCCSFCSRDSLHQVIPSPWVDAAWVTSSIFSVLGNNKRSPGTWVTDDHSFTDSSPYSKVTLHFPSLRKHIAAFEIMACLPSIFPTFSA